MQQNSKLLFVCAALLLLIAQLASAQNSKGGLF